MRSFAPFQYVKKHKKQIFLALLLALLVTGLFVFEKFLACAQKWGDGFTAPFSLLEEAVTEKKDGADLVAMLGNYIWGTFWLFLPVFVSIYWILRMSFLKKGRPSIEGALFGAARILFGFGGWGLILAVNRLGIYSVPLCFLSRGEGWNYERWLLAWLFLTLVMTDVTKIRKWMPKAKRVHGWFFSALIMVLTCSACFAIVELSCESKMNVFPGRIYLSLIYWVIGYLFLLLLTKRIRLSAYVLLGLAEFIGLGNYVVMQFRGTYVMSGDLLVIGTALEVAGNYKLVLDRYFFIPIAVLVLTILVIRLICPQPKRVKGKKKRERIAYRVMRYVSMALLAAIVGVGLYTGFLYGFIKGNTWNYTTRVEEDGYLPFFFANMMATSHITLDGYSVEGTREVISEGAAEYDRSHGAQSEVQEPNIIVIQNECLADLSVIYDYQLNTDCLPFIHSLTENTQKGYINASVTGGPTANTEFEFLTGFSLAYLPTGSIPYAQYVKTPIPSILTVLKNQERPYHTIGYHPYHASGYNRESVYQTLGFDEAIFYEDTEGMDRIRKLLTDRADYQDIIRMYEDHSVESRDPLFVFNVTIQNHSPFTALNDTMDQRVYPTDFDGSKGIKNYFTLLWESDRAFEQLVDYFSGVDQPTIILMYGDHQPSWDDTSKDLWDGRELSEDTDQQNLDKYYIPYIMWANYDIEEYDGLNKEGRDGETDVLSMNYMGSLLLENAGIRLSDFNKYQLNLQQEIPAVSSKGYWDRTGEWFEDTDQGSEADIEKLFQYNEVCYNLLFDRKHHLWEAFGEQE